MSGKSSAEIRAGLSHPVIDGDGHTVEFVPALTPYLRAEGVDLSHPEFFRIESGHLGPPADWHALNPEQRAHARVSRGAWSGVNASALDEATSKLPALLYDRLDDLGIDVSIVYPSFGLLFVTLDDADMRAAACRALNKFNADVFADYADRLVTVAAIPMHTPDEAVAELHHAHELGFKAIVMPGWVQRPVPAAVEQWPGAADWALWIDAFGIDSEYDYDPVWQTCRELGLSPSFHSSAMGWSNRRSVSNYVYNHVGMLGEAHHATAKSLLLGGVTKRFPDLGFCFLEGGVGWATSLYADLIGHWEKRNGRAMAATDPALLDWAEVGRLFEKYAAPWAADAPRSRTWRPADLALLDEFAASGVEKAEDFVDLFARPYYFGCEADDPITSTAFDTRVNPFGVQLQALFGSDVSHWDVPDMSEVLEESWEMVEHGLLSEESYRDFVFANPARFHTRANPHFFDGTVVADAVSGIAAER